MERGYYFEWLCSMIDMPLPDGTSNSMVVDHSILLNRLFILPYYWSIERDANRAVDAMSLRREFLNKEGEWYKGNISDHATVFEVLVALARRIECDIMGEGNNEYGRWFWMMIQNLDLIGFCDYIPDWDARDVDILIGHWLNRQFEPNGEGSPFPIEDPEFDQRDRELWFQMSDYIVEHYDF